jgi:hypothetical protein
MIPLGEFLAYFLAASAVTAVANAFAGGGPPGRIARDSLRLFLMIVVGIALFSALIFLLEWKFLGH